MSERAKRNVENYTTEERIKAEFAVIQIWKESVFDVIQKLPEQIKFASIYQKNYRQRFLDILKQFDDQLYELSDEINDN